MQDIKQQIKKNVEIAPYTTFKIGGSALYLFEARTVDDLIASINWALDKSIKFIVLGWGSNVLMSDKGFDGLVILNKTDNLIIEGNVATVDSGYSLTNLSKKISALGLKGLSALAGIPSSVGGAIRGNAGAYGAEISDFLESVDFFDVKNRQVSSLHKKQLSFSYRNSVFKQNTNVILKVAFRFLKGGRGKLIQEVALKLSDRKAKHPLDYPSAGCFFKNPEGTKGAWWLIKQAGLAGFSVGDAAVSEKHTNFIINKGKAKASDVLKLVGIIKKKVKEKSDIILEEEVQIIS